MRGCSSPPTYRTLPLSCFPLVPHQHPSFHIPLHLRLDLHPSSRCLNLTCCLRLLLLDCLLHACAERNLEVITISTGQWKLTTFCNGCAERPGGGLEQRPWHDSCSWIVLMNGDEDEIINKAKAFRRIFMLRSFLLAWN